MRKLVLSLMLSAFSMGAGIVQSVSAEISHPSGVVEMFTSQGCYSCPPADKIIGEYSKSGDVLALSWHVDYWDYLGWKDVFASKSNTERQYSYARTLRERQVYTPQAIINGRTHAVGSNGHDIATALKGFQNADQGMVVPVNASVDDQSLKISVPSNAQAKNATLYMVYFNKSEKVEITRGENGGKTLTYHNVVRDAQTLGIVKAGGFDMEFPIAEMKKRGFDSCALILQTDDAGGNPSAIIGATIISDL